MQFIRTEAQEGVAALEHALQQQLAAGKRILWLVSGGSNIPLCVQIMSALPEDITNRLTIMPVDERYGLEGHSYSNVKQLQDAGFIPKRAMFIPILEGKSPITTASDYANVLNGALAANEIILCQLGIGTDGHIAGILPHTNAVTAQTTVVASQGPDFLRITVTFPVLMRATQIYVFVYGKAKRHQLERLRDKRLPLDEQPAQFLKTMPEVYIYNDQIE